jgi:MOSC domain-containing protein YiiM
VEPGRIESIHVATAAGAPMEARERVLVVAGVGIAGDRYATQTGAFSAKPKPGRQITFIEAEAIEALARELGLVIGPGETRRNVVTRGVALNHLVDREFQVGSARFRGWELCEPCKYLAGLTDKAEILPGLVHRGGLRAEVLDGGEICVGDVITF